LDKEVLQNNLWAGNHGRYSNIVKLADIANNQLADVKTILLQISEDYKTQIGKDIYSISEELQKVIHGEMEHQVHHIQVLLADKLDHYKGKEEEAVNQHIQIL